MPAALAPGSASRVQTPSPSGLSLPPQQPLQRTLAQERERAEQEELNAALKVVLWFLRQSCKLHPSCGLCTWVGECAHCWPQ